MDLAERISKLTPQQKKLVELKLKQQGVDIDVLHIPITREDRKDSKPFPLSFAQERLWFIDQMDPGNPAYNIVRATKLEGHLDINALGKSINEMINRHEVLRTTFIFDNQKPKQVILPELSIPLSHIDLKGLAEEKQVSEIKQVKERESLYSFDLSKGPLLRTHLLELSPYDHIFLLVIHHIIADGISAEIFIHHLIRLYQGFSQGKASALPALSLQYADYACWQRRWFGENAAYTTFRKKQEEYWLNEFSGEIPVLALPIDYPRPVMQDFEGDIIYFKPGIEEQKALNELVSREKTTLFVVLLAVYTIFLSKLSGMEDIVVGTPVAGRRQPALQDMIGMFVNILALRNYPVGDKPFRDFLADLKARTLKAFDNQDYRYEDIIEKVEITRDTARNPLFDAAFLMQNQEAAKLEIPGLRLSPLPYEPKTSKFDLNLEVIETADNLRFSFEYCTKLFKEETIKRFSRYFRIVLSAVVENPEVRLAEIEIVGEEEKHQLLVEFNRTETAYPGDKTIHELFEDQVAKTPGNIALIFEDKRLTYNGLNERCNQLARCLRAKGMKPGSIIGIFADRSLELMVAIFAVLKAGGIYLPLDPTHPGERIKYMLKASHAAIILTDNQLLAKDEFVLLELDDEGNYKNGYSNLRLLNSPADPAYVIYTSGTTGIPKGVVIENRSFGNFIKGMTELIAFRGGERILSLTTVSFDIFGLETLVPLTRGAAVVMGSHEEQMDPGAAALVMEKQKITILQVTPSRLQLLLSSDEAAKQLPLLRYLLVGGEAFPERLLEQVRPLVKGNIYNVYGPTETTVWSTVKDLSGEACLTIGKPIANTVIHILDRYLRPVPIGVVGEIYIGGDGIARGYLNGPELTSEKFLNKSFWKSRNLFSKRFLAAGGTFYRTGDLGRWLSDGEIECFGRVDHQVKIRGFRIELGEIESHLKKHEKIRDAVTVAREDKSGGKYLCAYIVLTVPGETLSPSDLKIYLSDKLPDYMVPQFFQPIESIPLNASGKVDRKKLPEPEIALTREYIGPRNRIEQVLVDIWAEVLHIDKEKISINDNFFDLGGHSLNAAVLASLIHEKLHVKLALSQVFKFPLIGKLSEYITESLKNKQAPSVSYTSIAPAEEKEYYDLSPSQKRMYILNLFVDYQIPVAFEITGDLDGNRFQQVFQALVNRHESLRTSFHQLEGEAVQKIQERLEFKMEYYDSGDSRVSDILISEFFRAFDLSRPPLIRVGLVRLAENKHLFLINLHHLILDGVSVGILSDEFIRLYRGEELPELKVRYRDFSRWQNRQLKGELYRKQEAYWLEVFGEEIPVLNLPTDFPRPAMQRFEGDRVRFQVAGELFRGLKQLALTENASLYMVLLAVYFTLLFRYTGQEDIVTGTISAGRQQQEIQNLIGIFINPIALRSFPAKDKTFKAFLNQLKLNTLDAFENQLYPFGDLLEKVVKKKDLSRNPLFDVMLIFQNRVFGNLEIEGLHFSLYTLGAEHGILDNAQQDMTLWAVEEDERIRLELQYCTALYKRETMERFAGHFLTLLESAKENPILKLSEIEIITDIEKQQILLQFNDTETDFPVGKTIHQLFEQQVERTPDRIAVLGTISGASVTYRQLNQKTNQLAALLIEKGVKPNAIAAVISVPSIEMMVGLLGVLKAGGAYLPIDPDYPEERIDFMLKDSGARILLTHLPEGHRLFNCQLSIVNYQLLMNAAPNSLSHPTHLTHPTHPTHLSYIIYTSGTTGKPKGVMVEHRNAVAYVHAFYREFQLSAADTVIQLASYCFDVFVEEVFPILLKGGKLVIPHPSERLDMDLLSRLILKHNVSMIDCTPLLLNEFNKRDNLLENIRDVRLFISGGDVLKAEFVDRLLKIGKVYNTYGPTETTVCVTYYNYKEPYKDVDHGVRLVPGIPIGKPIANYKVYILDGNGKPVPIGVGGELCVSGVGLSRGYLNRPELTAEKYINYQSPITNKSELLYRTGDLARWLPDPAARGAYIIEFLGRIDHQVKIRGFRIELGEIEKWLLERKDIKEAVVLDKDDENGNKYLCAYIVPVESEKKKHFSVPDLRAYLLEQLPDYMIPSHFIDVAEIPLTTNGKIDTKTLLALEDDMGTGMEYVAPTNEVEKKLADMWSEILIRDRVGIHDNFFELGGQSLKAMRLVAMIREAFFVKIPLVSFFKVGTVKGIAGLILENRSRETPTVHPLQQPPQAARDYSFSGIKFKKKKRSGVIIVNFKAYETSSAQKRLYIINDLLGDSILYNENRVWIIHGNLDPTRLENVIKQISQRHESLRTCFLMKDGLVLQKVYDYIDVDFKYSQYTTVDIETVYDNFLEPYDLGEVPLWKVELAQVGENRQLILMDFHHIIIDGISMDVFMKELQALYLGVELPEPDIQYVDFAIWQNDLFAGEHIKKQEAYWLKLFEGEIPVLDLPTDFPRPLQGDITGTSIEFEMDEALTARVNQLGARSNTTLFVVLLAAFNVLLAKYSNQEDIVIGTPISGRTHREFQKIIGMFVNTLAMRNRPGAGKTFKGLLSEVSRNVFDAFENQDYQFEMLVEKLAPQRQLNRSPLFDVLFVLQNFLSDIDVSGGGNEEMAIIPYSFKRKASKFDLTLQVFESKRRIAFMLDYRVSLFRPETINRLKEHFLNILREVTENPGVLLSEIRMITDAEAEQLLYALNDTAADFPTGKTVHQLFEEQEERTPDVIAIQLNHRAYRTYMTYKELNEKSNQLAHLLRKKGVKPGRIVGIKIEPCVHMVVAILAVLKAGGGYLPIESEYPAPRIAYMLKDSSTAVLLGRKHLPENVAFEGETLFLDENSLYTGPLDNPAAPVGPGDVVYTIYTSGSTGMPKGVVLTHKNLVNYVTWFSETVGVTGSDRALLTSSLAFDLGYTVLYPVLLNGGEFHIIPRETYLFAEHLLDYIAAHRVTYIKVTPSLFATLVDDPAFTSERCQSLRVVVLGGEAIIAGDVQKAFNLCKGIRIMNHYGPTESTIGSIAQFIDAERIEEYVCTPTIGSPIHNTRVYILDKYLKLVPVNVAGELFIAGHGLAQGYLNRPELTAERFPPAGGPSYPTHLTHPLTHSPIYRTGDLARWLPGGRIEFLGRVDHQVKIRGYRIEMGEIENHLLTHEAVKEVAVLTWKNKQGVFYLAAYIVTEKNEVFDTGALKDYLAARLPDYMIPSFFVQLEKVPVTPNGKLDRRALPEPDVKEGQVYQPPADETEKKLVEIWSGVLGIGEDALSVDANFFELGGQSLSAAVVIARTHKALHVRIPMAELFKTPSIRGLARYINASQEFLHRSIEAVEKRESYPLSPAQKRLYILNRMDTGSTAYNMLTVLPLPALPGGLDMERLESIFARLIRRHESLRTSFHMVDEQPVQRVHDVVEFEIENYKLQITNKIQPAASLIKNFLRPFDLSRAPLLRAGLIETGETNHLLMVDMHHIASDGISRQVLLKEFMALCVDEASIEAFPPLPIQYKDFSVWQAREEQQEALRQQEAYWLKQFQGELPVLNLPTDYPRDANFEGEAVDFEIGVEETGALQKLVSAEGVTMFMALFALVNILLSKLSGQEDIVVGTPTAGRRHSDLEMVIGMFVNTLTLRNYPSGDKIFTAFLKEVKQRALDAFENQDYPFEELVYKVGAKREVSRNPLFDIMFGLQSRDIVPDAVTAEVFENNAAQEQDAEGKRRAKFDLSFDGVDNGEKLFFEIEYRKGLFKRETIQRFITYFKNIISSIIKNPEQKILDIKILTEAEKRQILVDFNDTEFLYPADKTIQELFQEQVERTPDHIAVAGSLHLLTYKQLNKKSNRLAHVLRSKGVGPDTIVPVMGGRTIEMIVGIMAVLEAGGAYLPIDPAYPEERIRYILADIGTAFVLNFENLNFDTVCTRDFEFCASNLSSSNLVYVLYTSGSTGRPKGVMVEHCQLVNLVYGLEDRIYKHYGNHLNVALVAPFMFDASVKQIFAALLLGHALHLVPEETRLDGSGLIEFYNTYQIDVSDGTPTHLRLMIECLKRGKVSLDLNHLLIGGEALPQQVVEDFLKLFATPAPRITNVYGPTECCVDSTAYEINRETRVLWEIVPIGSPMPNTQAYILSNSGGLVPPGVVGELYIGGAGVSRGYLGKTEKTSDAFVKNPFTGEKNRKNFLYRTGDLCRWLSDGNIEFLGRKDHQVKIRGFRVELGEIENQLLKHQEVKEAVVIDRKDAGGDRYLCAYIVPHSNTLPAAEGTFPTAELKEYLSKKLPGYMVPLFFTVMDRVPFTSSGKVDRKALPLPEIEVGEAYAAPRDAVEKTLVELWSELLFIGEDTISVDANFFDLGGHSLRAIILTAKIHKAFDVKVPLVEIFNAPTIRGLSRYISNSAKEIYTNIPAVEKKEYYRLSFAQKRMYILQQMDPQSVVYNIPQVIPLEIGIDEEKLENTFKQLINRHESLRTSFIMINEEPVQKIHQQGNYKLQITNYKAPAGHPIKIQNIVRPFDLSQGPLMRVELIKTEEEKYVLMVDMHHIITDAVSHGILAKEFMALYSGEELIPLRLQYKDYAEWENSETEREFWQKQEAYWLKEFEGEIPLLHLVTDFERPEVLGFKGSSISFKIDAALTGKIKQCASQTGVTLMMFLLSAYKIMLSKYSGQEELVVGTVISGRRHADLENVIGFFVNMLAIKTRPAKNKTFPDYLSEVKEKAVNAYENQDYQFEELVNKLKIQRQPGKHPLVDTVFAFHEADQQAPQAEENLVRGAHFDLMLYAIVVSDSISGVFEYSTDLFKRSTIEELSNSYMKVLEQVVENPNITLEEIKIDLNLLVSRSTVIQEDDKDWDL